MSGTGTAAGKCRPNMRPVWTIFGRVSIAAALNMLRLASARCSTGRESSAPRACTTGVPVDLSDPVVAVRPPEGGEPGRHLVVGLLPADLLPPVRRASNRPPQPVRVVVQLSQPVRLRTDVAAREQILL